MDALLAAGAAELGKLTWQLWSGTPAERLLVDDLVGPGL